MIAPYAPRLALCLTIVVYCLNMFGDAVRDLLDPRRGSESVCAQPVAQSLNWRVLR